LPFGLYHDHGFGQIGKKAFFIPTPGQYEQEYLAKKLQRGGLVPFASQDDFKLEDWRRPKFIRVARARKRRALEEFILPFRV
jgi:hypothetical protein